MSKINDWLGYNTKYIITHPQVIFSQAGREIKYAWQRVFDGYDERVIWSIDYWLNEKMPIWLAKLRDQKQGIPIVFFPEGMVDCNEEEMEKARLLWDAELDKMIAGFNAHQKMLDLEYTDNKDAEKLQETFEVGMTSLTKYYGSLWD